MLDEWYSPQSITFTKPQVYFILQNLELIRTGTWPLEGKETGYVGKPGKSRNARAPFETPVLIASEVSIRLDACGLRGKLLLAQIQADVPLHYLDFEAKMALRYCSGWRRKRMTFVNWANSWRKRNRVRV